MEKEILNKPSIIAVIGSINTGKSNFIYSFFDSIKTKKFNLYYYGINLSFIRNSVNINSIKELENIKNSIIVIDEMASFFNFNDRKQKRNIEKTLRLLHHNNNIIFLIGIEENFKKFISQKINYFFFKKLEINSLINGSKIKNIIKNYKGLCKGSELLNIPLNQILFYDNNHFKTYNVEYIKKYDKKINNVKIVT